MSRPPEYWLIGATQRLERGGFSPREAIRLAILEWEEQEWLANHRPDPTRYAEARKLGKPTGGI